MILRHILLCMSVCVQVCRCGVDSGVREQKQGAQQRVRREREREREEGDGG